MSKKLYSSMLWVSLLTLMAKSLGFLREVALGNIFGVGYESDVFFQAFKISIFLFLGAGGIITTSLIPEIVEDFERKDPEAAFTLMNQMMTLWMILSSLWILIIFTFGTSYAQVFTQYSGEELIYFTNILKVMFLSLWCFGPLYICTSFLHVNRKFLPNSLSSVAYNLFLMIYLLVFRSTDRIWGFTIVLSLGWYLQLLAVGIPTYQLGYRFKWTLPKGSQRFSRVIKKMPTLFIIVSLFGLLNLGDTMVVNKLPVGNVSALNYAFSLYGALATTIALSISTVLFPEISERIQKKIDEKKLIQFVNTQMNFLIYLFIPISAGIYVLSYDIVKLFFSFSGKFTASDYLMTSGALKAYFIGFVFFGFYELLTKIAIARKDIKFVAWASLSAVCLNFVLSTWAAPYFGVVGVASVTSLVMMLLAGAIWIRFGVQVKVLIAILKSCLAMVGMIFAMNILASYMDALLIKIIAQTALGVLVYAMLLTLFRAEEWIQMIGMFRRKKHEEV